MISKVSISGYRSIEKCFDLALRPLNVLIGPNRGGKTNFLDLFDLLSEGGREQLSQGITRRGGMDSVLWAGGARSLSVSLTLEPQELFKEEMVPVTYIVRLDKSGPSYVVAHEELEKVPRPGYARGFEVFKAEAGVATVHNLLSRSNETIEVSSRELAAVQIRDPIAYPTPDKIRRFLSSTTVHRPFATHDESSMRQAQFIESGSPDRPGTRLVPGGHNLTPVYYNLVNEPRWGEVWDNIQNILRVAFPSFRDLYFPTDAGAGRAILSWRDDHYPRTAFPTSALSDGTLSFLCLVAVLSDPEPPPLLCLDEPEVGLHPHLVKIVGELLQDAAERTQLIVATHSPQLITQLDAEDIIVVDSVDGQTKFERLDPEKLGGWLREFTLGELWLQGEIGGRP